MKKDKKENLLDALREGLNVTSACKKVGISRQTFYRWFFEDSGGLGIEIMDARREGELVLNDFTENQLMKKVGDGNMTAIRYRLDRKHPGYSKSKIEYSSKNNGAFIKSTEEGLFVDAYPVSM